jgi:hypothetical protein
MTLAIALSVLSIRRRDFEAHSAWSLRAYAIGMGAGTQVLTHIIGALVVGNVDILERALMMGAGWVINLVVAEFVIYRQSAVRFNRQMPASTVVGGARSRRSRYR